MFYKTLVLKSRKYSKFSQRVTGSFIIFVKRFPVKPGMTVKGMPVKGMTVKGMMVKEMMVKGMMVKGMTGIRFDIEI